MNAAKRILLVVVFLTGFSTFLSAQVKTDRVYLRSGDTRYNIRVVEETWKGILVDNNNDGKADIRYKPAQVKYVQYGGEPRYMTDARLHKNPDTGVIREPQQTVRKLTPIYTDTDVPARIRQHAYRDVALSYLQMAQTEDKYLNKAVEAYEKLFRDVPDTVYAVTGRFELAERLIEKKRTDDAMKTLKPVVDGKFGTTPAVRAKLILSRLMLSDRRFPEAEKLLGDLVAEKSLEDPKLRYEIRLMMYRAMIEQKKFDESFKGIEGVLAEKPGKEVLGMAYGVLGDHFAARGRLKTALTAYLKVIMMYPETGPLDRARARRESIRILEKLERREDADRLREGFKKKSSVPTGGES